MTNKRTTTPDGRALYNYSGRRHNRELFRWVMRLAVGRAAPSRGTVNARTGRVKFHHRWKGGRHAA